MKTLYLAQIGLQFFAVDKECVAGVGRRNDDAVKPVAENGKQYLPLPHGNRAVICDVQALMSGTGGASPARRGGYYLIVAHEDQFMALTMSTKGRIVMADVAAAHPLPPAFTGQSRALIPGVVVNCTDLILLVDLKAVLAAADGTAGPGCGEHGGQTSTSVH